MMLSDFNPAFTTTKLSSTLSTSAVITSPTRISLRVRLSSKRAANDSGAAGLGDCGCLEDAAEILAIRDRKTFQTEGLRPRVTLDTGRGVSPAHRVSFPATSRRCAPPPR